MLCESYPATRETKMSAISDSFSVCQLEHLDKSNANIDANNNWVSN